MDNFGHSSFIRNIRSPSESKELTLTDFALWLSCILVCIALFFNVWKNTTTDYFRKSHPHRCESSCGADHFPAPDPLCGADHGRICIEPALGHKRVQTTRNTYSNLYPNKQTEVAAQLSMMTEKDDGYEKIGWCSHFVATEKQESRKPLCLQGFSVLKILF